VPLAFYLRPEFEYVGSAPRKLGLVLAFIVAGASGISVFIADSSPDADPMTAMALAPVETLSIAMNGDPVAPAQLPGAEVAAQNLSMTGEKLLCQQNTAQDFSDCTQGKANNPRSVEAAKEGPAPAVGQVGGSVLRPSESTFPIVVTPGSRAGFAKRADAEPATEAAPASAVGESPTSVGAVKKARTHSSHVQRRDRSAYSPSRRYSYRNYNQNGYARVW
jgi:hypothetical protein